MGLKEDLISDLTGYDIEYQGKKLYVVKQFEYNKEIYLFVIHLDELPKTVFNFLKKENNTIYENVTDDKLFNELSLKMGELNVVSEIKKLKKNM